MHEIFLEKKHRKTLVRYVSSDDNLKLIMNMLRIKKVVLQFAVYDVFTLFLANTEKTPEVERILYKNREILKGFLSKLTKEGARRSVFLSMLYSTLLLRWARQERWCVPNKAQECWKKVFAGNLRRMRLRRKNRFW